MIIVYLLIQLKYYSPFPRLRVSAEYEVVDVKFFVILQKHDGYVVSSHVRVRAYQHAVAGVAHYDLKGLLHYNSQIQPSERYN